MEIWKDVKGYEGLYQVSSLGRIKSMPKTWISGNGKVQGHEGILLKTAIGRGYLRVGLSKDSIKKLISIHRIVASAFLPCADSSLTVNHKDGNKLNNNIENLEWVTSGDNTRHAHKNGLCKNGGLHNWAKIVLDTQTGIFYETLNDAAFAINKNVSTLSNYLTGKLPNRTSMKYV